MENKQEYLDYPVWKLFSTPNSFTITPATPFSTQKSLVIDKQSTKIMERGINNRV
jgi:hypothetical protein